MNMRNLSKLKNLHWLFIFNNKTTSCWNYFTAIYFSLRARVGRVVVGGGRLFSSSSGGEGGCLCLRVRVRADVLDSAARGGDESLLTGVGLARSLPLRDDLWRGGSGVGGAGGIDTSSSSSSMALPSASKGWEGVAVLTKVGHFKNRSRLIPY